MKERFKDIKFTGNIKINLGEKGYWEELKRNTLSDIKKVCDDYLLQGYTLTLRQLYYQIVAKDLIPNHKKVYDKLGKLKDELVYSGEIDWEVFEDRGRVPHMAYTEDDVSSALENTARYYNLDKQIGQKNHIEVWTEKDAISGILKRVTNPYTVTLVVNKGYTSSTAIYNAYERFMERIENGQKVVILYFGDHDPSGLDMIRDIRERLMFMFCNGERYEYEDFQEVIYNWIDSDISDLAYSNHWQDADYWTEKEEYGEIDRRFNWTKLFFSDHFKVVPIGLTMAQIKEYNPPPNPAKIKDPRASGYVKKFGKISWEVDALKPRVMQKIVKDKIEEYMDMDIYNEVLKRQVKEITQIRRIIDNLNNNA